jgi:putative salt-induced outer membrane protein YdiY
METMRFDTLARAARAAAMAVAAAAASLVPTIARGDIVVFKNGDRLTGTIGSYEGGPKGKLTIKTKVAGDVKVDLADVETFSTDGPIDVKLADGSVVHQKITAGKPGEIDLAGGGNLQPQALPLAKVAKINPPPVHWTGSIAAGGQLLRGNTDSEAFNAEAKFLRRSDIDRITLDGQYFYARQRDTTTGNKSTTTDNWNADGKYDYFFTPKFYGYGDVKVAKDRIAFLDLRFAPGAGVGYQWVERDDFNFNTEGGVGWFYERYTNDGTRESGSLRLAYHVDYKINEKVKIFHDLEYFPKFDSVSDFFLTTDAGVRVTLTKNFFTEFKAQLDHNNRPAPGKQKDDTRYLKNLGWTFE